MADKELLSFAIEWGRFLARALFFLPPILVLMAWSLSASWLRRYLAIRWKNGDSKFSKFFKKSQKIRKIMVFTLDIVFLTLIFLSFFLASNIFLFAYKWKINKIDPLKESLKEAQKILDEIVEKIKENIKKKKNSSESE